MMVLFILQPTKYEKGMSETMNAKKIIKWISIVVCIGIFAGAIYLFNDIFPKAKPIRLPNENIISVSLGCSTPDMTIPMSELYYEELLTLLKEAKPTRKQALDDYPSARPYYGVSVRTDDIEYRYFIYESGNQIYVEMPYEGIYEADTELFDLVLQYFQEG